MSPEASRQQSPPFLQYSKKDYIAFEYISVSIGTSIEIYMYASNCMFLISINLKTHCPASVCMTQNTIVWTKKNRLGGRFILSNIFLKQYHKRV